MADFTMTDMLHHELEQWRKRMSALDREIIKYQAERDQLAKKIEAAEIIVGVPAGSDKRSLLDEIEELMRDGKARLPGDIRRDLIARGIPPDRVKSTTGYFYTTLARLVERKVLAKDGRGRYVARPSELKVVS